MNRVYTHGDLLSRGQARRLSRRFTTVGVQIEPDRLQQIWAGSPCAEDEHVDVNFALVATAFHHEARNCALTRARSRLLRWSLIGAMTLLSLSVLICLTLAMLSMVEPTFDTGTPTP
ncbi:hypothetical protein ABIA30_000835 [Mycobacterium sp. MAA66]|uniref:hypothetical protein n=1 Tax=Mycobacterium sp. MAA66 TaxID=3156297 RepID=UPI003515FC3D